MHYSCSPDTRHLATGDTFVASTGVSGMPLVFLTVVTAGRGSEFSAIDSERRTWKQRQEGSQRLSNDEGRTMQPVWTLALPTGDRVLDSAYIGLLSSAKGYDTPILLHLGTVKDGHTTARLVFPAFKGEEASRNALRGMDEDGFIHGEEVPDLTWTRLDKVAYTDQEVLVDTRDLPEGSAPSDMVAASLFDCEASGEDFVIRLKKKAAIVGHGIHLEDLGRFVPVREVPAGEMGYSSAPGFANPSDYADECMKAHARTQPDEALVLWMPSGDGEGTECRVLGHTGYVFMITDSIEDQFWNENVSPGLWIYRDARFWSYTSYEGEHDWGIEGDWTPASPEDITRFGFETQGLSAEMREYLTEIGHDASDGDLVVTWTDMASRAAEAERATQEISVEQAPSA